jgi:hypothetical protein
LAPQKPVVFLARQLEHEIPRESRHIAFHRSHQGLGLDAVKQRQVAVEHDLLSAEEVNALLDSLGRND